MNRLCQYRDVLGVPREGVHSHRVPVVDMAAFDVLGTLLLAMIVSTCWNTVHTTKVTLFNYLVTVLLLCAAGEMLHCLFCVPTRFQALLEHLH